MPNITDERLEELELAERKLNALETSGVSHWDFYDDAMAPIRAEKARKEFLDNIVTEILEEIGGEFEEPAGRGAGIAITNAGRHGLVKYLGTLNIPVSKR